MFLGLAGEIIARTRAAGRYTNVRWWGEMVNVLWERGDVAASMNLEDLFDRVSREQNVAVFCSFLMDNFNGDVHTRMLPRLGDNHSHLIPVEDYGRLERAVAEALRETVGPDEAVVLQDRLLSQYQAPFQMPPAAGIAARIAPDTSDGGRGRAAKEPQLLHCRSGAPVTAQSVIRSDGWAHFRADHHTASACSTTIGLIDILDAVDVPIVVVGREFVVTCFNRAAAELLGFAPSDIGRSPDDVPVLGGLRDLEAWCAQAIATGAACRYDFRDRDKSYLLRIAPYAQSDGRITGSVLTFANVTAFRASIDQAIYEREYTKTILNTVTDPLAVLSGELRLLTGNRAFYTMFHLSREATQSIPLGEIGNRAFDLALLHMRLRRTLGGR